MSYENIENIQFAWTGDEVQSAEGWFEITIYISQTGPDLGVKDEGNAEDLAPYNSKFVSLFK